MLHVVRPLLAVVLFAGPCIAQEDLWQLYNSGDREGALERALALLEDRPDDRDLHHVAGRALADLRRNDEARPHLERCTAGSIRDWRYAWSLFYLGGMDISAGDYEAARAKWIEVRDSRITQNVADLAVKNLRGFGLDEAFDDWIHRESEHLRAQFSPAHQGHDLDGWMEEHERAWDTLVEQFGGAPAAPVRYLVWKDVPEARELCGIRSLGFAKPEYYLVHCLWGQTVGHELAHVVVHHALQPQVATRFINEGIAVAHDLTQRDRMKTARRAMAEAGVEVIDVRLLWAGQQPGGDEVLYPVSGAWIDFLLRREGREKLHELARNQTPEAAQEIYGPALAEHIDAFERELND